jgi:hypothetical protein
MRFLKPAKAMARRVRHRLLVKAIETAQALSEPDNMTAELLRPARRAIET